MKGRPLLPCLHGCDSSAKWGCSPCSVSGRRRLPAEAAGHAVRSDDEVQVDAEDGDEPQQHQTETLQSSSHVLAVLPWDSSSSFSSHSCDLETRTGCRDQKWRTDGVTPTVMWQRAPVESSFTWRKLVRETSHRVCVTYIRQKSTLLFRFTAEAEQQVDFYHIFILGGPR